MSNDYIVHLKLIYCMSTVTGKKLRKDVASKDIREKGERTGEEGSVRLGAR